MNAQQLYREAGVLGANPVELVIRLYEKMVDDLRQVSEAIENNDIKRRTDRIKHAILIVGHLQSSLDFENGGKVAWDLEIFYKTLRFRLLHLQFHPSKPAVAQLTTDLLTLREAWIQVERAENPRAAATGTAEGAAPYVPADDGTEPVRGEWQG